MKKGVAAIFTFVALALLLSTGTVFAAGESTVHVTLLHWNDLHANNLPQQRVEDGDTIYVGGVANLGGYLNHYRELGDRTLVLNAGDDFQGTPISTITRGHSQIELLNLLEPNAYEIGNHEFDYGVDNVLDAFSEANFPVLMGNVVRVSDHQPLFPADTVITLDGVRIGIIGVMTKRFKAVTTAKATAGLMVEPAVDVIRHSLKRLDPITDIQIVLSHSGVDEDSAIAAQIGPEIEMIVGGHSHTLLRHPLVVNGVPIVQAGAKGRWLGVVEMDIDTTANRLVDYRGHVERIVQGTYPPDEEVEKVVEAQEKTLSAEMDKVIATLKTPWTREYQAESNLGDWVADAFRAKAGANIGAINSGGLRTNVDAGPLTVRDIYEVSPFGNELVRFTMTGADVKTFVLHQAEKPRDILQISGLRYHVKDGKIVSLTVDGKPVQNDANYTVATINYVTDHFKRFFGLDPALHAVEPLGYIDRDVLLEAAKDQGTIDSKVENRAVVEP